MTAAMAMQWDAVLAVDERSRGRGYGCGVGWGDGGGEWLGVQMPITQRYAGAGATNDHPQTLWNAAHDADLDDRFRPARACLTLMEVRI